MRKRGGRRRLSFAILVITASMFAGDTPASLLYRQAQAHFAGRQFEQCLTTLERALLHEPDHLPALTLKARLAMAVNRFDLAQSALETALAYHPESAATQFLYGFHFHLRNDLPRALAELEKAREMSPRDARPTLYLALTQESLGNTAEALALYREGIRLQEESGKLEAESLLGYARLLFIEGDIAGAESAVRRARTIEPNSRDPFYELARILLQKGEAAGAAGAAETALSRPATGITDRQIHYLLVKAYGQAGDTAAAKRHAAAVKSLPQPQAHGITGAGR